MTYRDQRIGKAAQDLAEQALRSRGANFCQQIPTPYRVIMDNRTGKNRMIFAEKALGDIFGSVPISLGGYHFVVPFIAEVKYSDDDSRLIHSRLAEHQVERLMGMVELGWLALLVWVNVHGVFVLRWPVPGFERGTSLTIEQAQRLNIMNLHDAVQLKRRQGEKK